MAQIHRLTATTAKVMHNDGGGLYLQITTGREDKLRKPWLYRFSISGKTRDMESVASRPQASQTSPSSRQCAQAGPRRPRPNRSPKRNQGRCSAAVAFFRTSVLSSRD